MPDRVDGNDNAGKSSRPIPPDETHDACIVRDEWHRALGISEAGIAVMTGGEPPDDLADELRQLWIAPGIQRAVEAALARVRQAAGVGD